MREVALTTAARSCSHMRFSRSMCSPRTALKTWAVSRHSQDALDTQDTVLWILPCGPTLHQLSLMESGARYTQGGCVPTRDDGFFSGDGVSSTSRSQQRWCPLSDTQREDEEARSIAYAIIKLIQALALSFAPRLVTNGDFVRGRRCVDKIPNDTEKKEVQDNMTLGSKNQGRLKFQTADHSSYSYIFFTPFTPCNLPPPTPPLLHTHPPFHSLLHPLYTPCTLLLSPPFTSLLPPFYTIFSHYFDILLTSF